MAIKYLDSFEKTCHLQLNLCHKKAIKFKNKIEKQALLSFVVMNCGPRMVFVYNDTNKLLLLKFANVDPV